MRIELDTPDPQVVNEKIKKMSAGVTSSADGSQVQGKQDFDGDQVSLSALASQAMGTSDVRQNKIDALRQSIDNGTYEPDSNGSAAAMLNF
jgi:flagellar biosynthesis anti-sigma factor FlgM